jgi:hypothetical protein
VSGLSNSVNDEKPESLSLHALLALVRRDSEHNCELTTGGFDERRPAAGHQIDID